MSTRLRPLIAALLLLGLTFAARRLEAQTAVSVGVQIGDFRVAVSNYYHVPEHEVVVIHDRSVRDEEIPVVLFIAQRASVPAATIVDLRLRGMSWWAISTRYHLGAEAYYIPVSVTPGPPYGKAIGHFKQPRENWNMIVLADDDILNLVHLRFLSDYYNLMPEKVIALRGTTRDLVAVQHEVSAHGKKDDDKKSPAGNSQGSNGRGRGRGGQ